MKANLIVAALAAVPTIAAPLAASAQIQSAIYDGSGAASLERVQFIWGGRNYCWYDGGWHGPGWYRCGFSWRRGYGWGGPMGWHGWRYNRRHYGYWHDRGYRGDHWDRGYHRGWDRHDRYRDHRDGDYRHEHHRY